MRATGFWRINGDKKISTICMEVMENMDITVAVTISDQTITSIAVTDYADDNSFFGRAEGLLDTIVNT